MLAYLVFNGIVILAAVVGNLLIMLVVVFNRLFHNMRHFLLASLALSDFILVTFVLPPRVVSVAYQKWIFGEGFCQGNAFLVRVLYVNSFLKLCSASYDRYQAIVKDHLTYDGHITLKKVFISVPILWILPTVISLGPFLGWGGFDYKPSIFACGQRWDLETTFPFLIFAFITPILIISVLTYKVMRVARRLERKVNIQLGNMNQAERAAVEMMKLDAAFARQASRQYSQELKRTRFRSPSENMLHHDLSRGNPTCSQERSLRRSSAQEHLSNVPSTSHIHHFITNKEDNAEDANQTDANEETVPSACLMKILKECKASTDVMITVGALLVCFLPVWINNVYYTFNKEPSHSSGIFWIHSLYSAATLCNPIIYSVRKREFRKEVRKILKI